MKKLIEFEQLKESMQDSGNTLSSVHDQWDSLPDAEPAQPEMTITCSVDRTHEECEECALEKVEPTRCTGHVSGPSSCIGFVRKDRGGE